MLLLITAIIALLSLLVGIIVFIRNTSSKPNQLLLTHTLFVNCWMVSNYFSNDVTLTNNISLIANHLVLFFGAGVVLSLNVLLQALSPSYVSNWWQNSLLIIGAVAGLLSLTPLVVSDIEIRNDHVAIMFGPAAIAYVTLLTFFIVRLLVLLKNGIHNSYGIQRARLQVVGIGIVIAFGVLLVTNVLLPFTANRFEATSVGPLAFVVLVLALTYSIVTQRLFDITPAIIRTFGYAVTLLLLIILYSICIHAVNDWIFKENISSNQRLLSQVLVVTMIVLFNPIKKLVDAGSSKLFYRERYNSQTIISRVTDILVSEINEQTLLAKTVPLINHAINAKRIIYITYPNLDDTVFFSAAKTPKQAKQIAHTLPHSCDLYVRSDISSEKIDIELTKLDLDIIMLLDSTSGHSGALLFGPKRNGSAYSKQDIELLSVLRKTLSVAIQNARNHQEVLDFNKTLHAKVKTATSKLAKTNNELQKLSATKDEFVSMASHQIHPLLVAGRGFLDLLKDETNDKERKQLNDLAIASLERTSRVISDMLNLSEYSAGKLAIYSTRYDLRVIVQKEVAAQMAFITTAGFTINVTKHRGSVHVMVDETKIREAIANLIHNAVQYGSHTNPRILLAVYIENDQAVCTVTDYGIGVPTNEQRVMFKKFYRGNNAQDIRPNGSGLGLFLVDKIITAHDGTVIFTPNKIGSTFGFSLPLKN